MKQASSPVKIAQVNLYCVQKENCHKKDCVLKGGEIPPIMDIEVHPNTEVVKDAASVTCYAIHTK